MERSVTAIAEANVKLAQAKASLVQIAYVWLFVLFLLSLVPLFAVSVRIVRWAMGG